MRFLRATLRFFPFLPVPLLCLAFWSLLLTAHPAHAGPGFWTPLGPGAGYQTTGCVTVHPGVPGTVWACLPHGGFYRSADRGATWRWTGQPFTGTWEGAEAVAADPARPNALWGATSSAVYRTEDGGLHWALLTGTGYRDAMWGAAPFQMLPLPGALYVAASKRLLASPDGGSAWTVLYDAGENGGLHAFAAHAAHPSDLYLAGYGPGGPYLFRSSDAGNSWDDLTAQGPVEDIRELAATSTALYASGNLKLFRSTDRGMSWRDLLAGKPGTPAEVYGWTLDPRAPRTLYVAGTLDSTSPGIYLWVSRNEGNTWKKLGKLPVYPHRLAVDSAAGALYTASDEALARSLDGGATWKTVLRVPSQEGSCAQLSFQPHKPARLDLAVGGIAWRSANNGRSWSLRGAPSWGAPSWVTDLDVDPEDPYRLVAVAGSYATLSEDGGRTWRRTSGALWYAESLTRVDGQTLIAAGAGLSRSGDNGETWQEVLPPWTPEVGRWPQKLEVDPADPSKIYALVFLVDDMELPHDPLDDYPSNLWKSTDGGRTWRKVARNLRAFALDRATSHLYGVRNRTLLKSTDEGKTWTPMGGRAPYAVHDLVIDPTDPDVFYVAAWGVLRSTDRGATWKQLGDQYIVNETYALTLHPADPRTLYAADRWGVREITVPEGYR